MRLLLTSAGIKNTSAERLAAGIPGPAYAIDDETAIKVVGGTVEVVSEGTGNSLAPDIVATHRDILAMRVIVATALLLGTAASHAATVLYDESADAKVAIGAALDEASKAKVPVLVVFGANWCGDCRVLDMAFKTGASAPLIQKNFKVVKVDVGRFDHNVDIAESYGVPLKSGIPAVAVLSARGEVLYATRSGELADARNMGDKAIYEFFARVAAPVK